MATTTVDITAGTVNYKLGIDGDPAPLQQGATLTFHAITGAPRLVDNPTANDLRNWQTAMTRWMRAQYPADHSAPCFGSASTPGNKLTGTFKVTAGEPLLVRTYGAAGAFTDQVLTAGNVLSLDTIEVNAITAALYGVQPA
jgi:hypothetical protein